MAKVFDVVLKDGTKYTYDYETYDFKVNERVYVEEESGRRVLILAGDEFSRILVRDEDQEEASGPCDLCRWGPPSSIDGGKPCVACPAIKKG